MLNRRETAQHKALYLIPHTHKQAVWQAIKVLINFYRYKSALTKPPQCPFPPMPLSHLLPGINVQVSLPFLHGSYVN